MYKLSVFISGRGSNLKAILGAIESGFIQNANVSCVISNNADAMGLKYARDRGIETLVRVGSGVSKEEYDADLVRVLEERGVDFVLLAGFMRVLTPVFVKAFKWKILNIHPSLLPAFRGLHAQRQALKAGVKITGATVHFVTEELDGGPIIIQSAVPVLSGDTEESLSNRILKTEHKIYPIAVKLLVEKRLRIVNNRVEVMGEEAGEFCVINPVISGV